MVRDAFILRNLARVSKDRFIFVTLREREHTKGNHGYPTASSTSPAIQVVADFGHPAPLFKRRNSSKVGWTHGVVSVP